MDNNKRDFDDFFQTSDNEAGNEETRKREEDRQERPSYYYSYGPYKSPMEENGIGGALSADDGTAVEMTAPRPVKPIPTQQETAFSGNGGWRVNEPHKRTSFKSVFAAFMAGAVVVASLMFAADRTNLFTGGQLQQGSGGASASGSVSAGSSNHSGSAKSVAYDVARPSNISEIVQSASPAVVKVDTYVKAKTRQQRSNTLFDDPFFRYFFGDDFSPSQPQQKEGTRQQSGMGTGFIFEASGKTGYILTNEHVIDGADEIEVTVQGYDEPFKAELLGNSYDLDLAVLKIEGDKEFPTLPLGDANQMNVGDWVIAIGNPYGFDHTVTVGVLSAKERPITISDTQGTRNYKHLFQTDASINPGNSGGPLLNLNGEVIGINTAVSSQAQGIGFAIPTSTISSVLDNLKNNIEIPKEPSPYIGVSLSGISQSYLKELNLESTDGALVADVVLGSPAFKAGVKKYDVITGIDGTAVKNGNEITEKIRSKKVGDKVTLNIVRDGKKIDVDVTIGDRNADLEQQKKQQG